MNKPGTFRDVRARALRTRVDALQKQLDAVMVLCDIAEHPGATQGCNQSTYRTQEIISQLLDLSFIRSIPFKAFQAAVDLAPRIYPKWDLDRAEFRREIEEMVLSASKRRTVCVIVFFARSTHPRRDRR